MSALIPAWLVAVLALLAAAHPIFDFCQRGRRMEWMRLGTAIPRLYLAGVYALVALDLLSPEAQRTAIRDGIAIIFAVEAFYLALCLLYRHRGPYGMAGK